MQGHRIGGVYELQHDGTVTKYYAAFGRSVAMRSEDPAAGDPETGANCGDLEDDDTDSLVDDGCPMYLLADHLGGTTHVLDSAGIVRSGQRYWPYGAVRSGGISETDVQYTGQRAEPGDSALGLYNYKARFFSTTLGRFVSPDPVADGLNRYSYVQNSPANYMDPNGQDHCGPPCPSRAPSPSKTPLPNQSDIDNCAQHLAACLTFSFVMDYGISPAAVVFVMGLTQSFISDMGGFASYAVEFLERYHPGCKGRAAQCWRDAQALGSAGGADKMYEVFGIQFIESDWNGLFLPGIGAAWAGLTDQGMGALKNRLDNLLGKDLKGVIGYSLGGDTVARFFLNNPEYGHVPFYLDSAYATQAVHSAKELPNSAGRSGFFDRYCGGAPCGHHSIDGSRASEIFDRFEALRVEVADTK